MSKQLQDSRTDKEEELYWIDKCGHAAMMEHPEKFNSIILKWLKNSLEK
mgnify:CR=1 FL=1